VVRSRSQTPKAVELIREKSAIPPVETKVLEGNIGYLRVRSLPAGISKELATRIEGLRRGGARKFLLDVRDAASGDLQEGTAVANLFIAEGLLGFVEGQQYPRQNFLADKSKAVAAEPASVLVNESTGGAAEVLAAAFLDTHRGDVVGARTFGIGAIQKVIPLPDGAAVVLSVAKFHSPAGKKIQDSGVLPSEVIEQPRDIAPLEDEQSTEYVEPEPTSSRPKEDLQLKRAIELLQQDAAEEMPKAA
jgi:carboxyl-terminal processing protease